jgi:hypothetical protein
MPLPPELLAEIYDLYLGAAVELRQITCLERDQLRRLRLVLGICPTDVEQIRESLVSPN